MLGPVAVLRDGAPVTVPAGRTTELLVRLALEAGHPVRAERLLSDLWPDAAGTRPNTLQAKVSQLRRALGTAAVTSEQTGYALHVDRVDVTDALTHARAAGERLAAGDAAGALDECRAGLALFGTEVLPGAGEWAGPDRGRLEEARLRLTEDEVAARQLLGAAGELVGELETLVDRYPMRERLWSALVTALYRAGRQADALAALRRVRRLLADELGVDPGPELTEVERRVLAHDPDLAPAAPVRRAGNVGSLSGPLVGRATELAALRSAVAAHRLVTITGPAGVGKTRLATELARADPLPGGAWLVRLDGARTAADLPAALADTIPGVDPADVAAGLRGSEPLLVLDNCEHVADDVAALCTVLLDAVPGLHVLATSQRRLGLDGEVVQVLAPLEERDAVALFARRAVERRPSFTMTGTTEDAVVRLCRALDGLPLAIELAAARARALTVDEIARRLDDRFTLLTDPTSARPERSRTLAAALAWSYDLLFPDDRRGLWALAQFPSGAGLPALEHVLGALDVPAATALDVVERLIDRSLVVVQADEQDGVPARYRLLDSVREFARARVTEADADATAADALVVWVRELADAVDAGVRGPEQAAYVATTAAERATIDTALERARAHDPETALRIAAGFGWAWVLLDDTAAAGRLRAARTTDAPVGLRVRGLLLEAWLGAMSGDLRPARSALDDAVALAAGDPALADVTGWFEGFVLMQEGRLVESADRLRRAALAFAASGDRWYHGGSLLIGSFAHGALGDLDAAQIAAAEAARIIEPLDDAWGLQHAEAALGRVAQAQGRFADAVRHHGTAAAAAQRLGFPGATALHRAHLGQSAHALGDPDAPATLHRAEAEAERAGDLRLVALVRVMRAEVELARGDRATAVELLTAADRWFTGAGGGEGAARAAELLAELGAGV